ncbi:hypothetical protein Y1Q_0014014 [Alligator mississippiensis]|uniref:Uncharacterized protein n=1 Tax=Alligator mississippiensis TaxID=8496 RepID=A0A151PDW1_ALLMI|nr:hypothetical protein Y1Q_0014014 [Alligator mississippiensis]
MDQILVKLMLLRSLPEWRNKFDKSFLQNVAELESGEQRNQHLFLQFPTHNASWPAAIVAASTRAEE